MTTPNTPPNQPAPESGAPVDLANPSVVVEGVSPTLLDFVAQLGWIHRALFGANLVITSGKDGQHVAGSLHAEGRAVDLRVNDLIPEHANLFVHCVTTFLVEWDCRLFDERVGPGGPHLHLEYHGT